MLYHTFSFIFSVLCQAFGFLCHKEVEIFINQCNLRMGKSAYKCSVKVPGWLWAKVPHKRSENIKKTCHKIIPRTFPPNISITFRKHSKNVFVFAGQSLHANYFLNDISYFELNTQCKLMPNMVLIGKCIPWSILLQSQSTPFVAWIALLRMRRKVNVRVLRT